MTSLTVVQGQCQREKLYVNELEWDLLQNFECAEDLLERTTDFSETVLVMLLRTPGLGKSFPTPNR